jgi:hypothetical protein
VTQVHRLQAPRALLRDHRVGAGLRLRDQCEHLVRQAGDIVIGHGLDAVVEEVEAGAGSLVAMSATVLPLWPVPSLVSAVSLSSIAVGPQPVRAPRGWPGHQAGWGAAGVLKGQGVRPGSSLFTSGIAALPEVSARLSCPTPAGHWPLPGADEQEIGQIEQPEQGHQPGDDSQDA